MLLTMDKIGFGQWLQFEREKRGLTQSQLARMCGIDRQIINKTENAVSAPATETFIAISDALGIHINIVLQKAGLRPAQPDNDPLLEQIDHVYLSLRDPTNKQSAVKYLEYLLEQEQKWTNTDARQNPQLKPH